MPRVTNLSFSLASMGGTEQDPGEYGLESYYCRLLCLSVDAVVSLGMKCTP